MKKVVFGICGPIGSGKGTVTDWFKDRGFITTSLSDEIRIELTSRGREITRSSLQEVGNHLRESLGDTELAKRAWKRINQGDNPKVVLESIRHPQEAKYLKDQGNFYLISVIADQKVRFQRYMKRKNSEDETNWDQFLQEDTEEAKGHNGEHGQLVEETAKLADFVVDNSASLEETYSQLASILDKVGHA